MVLVAYLIIILLSMFQMGCIAVGYSSGGGWFIWPGLTGLLAVVVLFALLKAFFRR